MFVSITQLLRDILIFVNEKNLLKPPITLTYDQIKTEFTALRRQNKTIRIGICRCTDRSLLNNTTVRHLGSLTFNEFRKLSIDDRRSTSSFNESHRSLIILDDIPSNSNSKQNITNKSKLTHEHQSKPLVYKRSTSPARDSGFIETDGTNTSLLTDRSVLSNYYKHRSKISLEKSEDESMDTHKSLDSLQQSISKTTSDEKKTKSSGLIYSIETANKQRQIQRQQPSQTVTDACFIYRRQAVKQDMNNDEKEAMILRGREIAYEAANTPAIPSSMQTYSRDQIRELYGELDRKTRRLQEDEYTIHAPMTNSWSEKPQWKLASPTKSKTSDECPLPKFRLEKSSENDEALLMAAYLSSGMNSPQTKPTAPVDNLYQVMINASAKVNEWAHNNEIYLSPTENEFIPNNFRPIIDSSTFLLDTQLNLKQLTGSPTHSHTRPTVLETSEQQQQQQQPNQSNHAFTNRNSRRSIRRQLHTVHTITPSPDSIELPLEITPSTPGSCGMYLEPYMNHGYDLPSIDHHIRDSSWQHADNDDLEDSLMSMKNITPTDSPTITAKFDMDVFPSPPLNSQIIEADSLIDLDDGTTTSYHTAKESRIDNGHQSSLSIGSDDTNGSNFPQYFVHDDLINNIVTPEETFYYDAIPSPLQTTQQISSTNENSDVLIENLTDLLEQIDTYNRTNNQITTNIDEEQAHILAKGEESLINIDQLVSIVGDIHRCNQTEISNTMDDLAFIYDNLTEESTKPSIDNLVEIVQSIDQTSSCVNNLVFIYDDTITPTEDEPKQVVNDSDEWSYDNLIGESDEQVNTDNLGTIVHEALNARYQKSVQFNEIHQVQESIINIDNLVQVVNEALSVSNIDQDASESSANTDNLGTIIHEALAARFQKPIKMKTSNPFDFEVFTEELPESFDQLTANTDNLGTLVNEALEGPYQKSFTMIPNDSFHSDIYSSQLSESSENESIIDTDNLGTIIHEALAARFQQPIKFQIVDQAIPETPPSEEIPKTVDEASLIEMEPIDLYTPDVVSNELMIDSNDMEPMIYRASPVQIERLIEMETPESFDSQMISDETISNTLPLDALRQDELEIEDQNQMENTPVDEHYHDYSMEESNDDTIEYEILKESVPSSNVDNTHTSETIAYEIESSMPQPNIPINEYVPPRPPLPVNNLSQIVSDSLLSNSNYHQFPPNENQIEFHILHPPVYDEEIYEEYGYRRTTTEPGTDDIVDKFEELCHRYSTNFERYRTTTKQFDDDIDQLEKQLHEQREHNASPVSDTISEELITTIERVIDNGDEKESKTNDIEESYTTVIVTRQADHLGRYGFDFEAADDGKIKISSIIDGDHCPNLSIGDEIISLDDSIPIQTYEQCKSSLNSLWIDSCENIQITIVKTSDIRIAGASETVSLQSSSLSWPLSIAESGRIIKYDFARVYVSVYSIQALLICGP
ncbi:hypothetical protein I4U23_007520 [Adineta vaga]|nr:hypothetical protein I4U23_007520 [Adineta vaga]